MKKILLLYCTFFAILLAGSEKSFPQKNDLMKAGITGKVKSLAEYDCNYTIISGKVKATATMGKVIIFYDTTGNVTDKKVYDSKGILLDHNQKKYNANRKLILDIDSNSTYPLTNKLSYKYDSLGNCTESIWYNPDNTIKMQTAYIFDSAGRETERYEYKGDELNYKILITYDKNESWSKMIYVTAGGEFDGKTEYMFDSIGNVIDKKIYDHSLSLKSQYTYQYDGKGNMTRYENIDDMDDLFGFEINTYDSLGRKIHKYEKTSWDGKLSTDDYMYDEKGNLIYDKYEEVNSYKTTVYSYEYIYDSEGNWTDKINYTNKAPTAYTKREISYY
jgi:hypothetical protein